MNRITDAEQGSMRLAFWGYTNTQGARTVVNIARQLRACEAALEGRTEIDRFFYAMRQPINDFMMLAVRGAGGPSRRDGGWDDLAAVLSTVDRGFETIICASRPRLGRTSKQLHRLDVDADHGATILCADEPLPEFPELTGRSSDRLLRQVTTALREHDYASVDALIRTRRGMPMARVRDRDQFSGPSETPPPAEAPKVDRASPRMRCRESPTVPAGPIRVVFYHRTSPTRGRGCAGHCSSVPRVPRQPRRSGAACRLFVDLPCCPDRPGGTAARR